jgi:formylglycine-generating enzyme required for sulfatase activity
MRPGIQTRSALSVMVALFALSACSPERTYRDPVAGMDFVLIPAGEYTMGAPSSDRNRRPDETAHRVVIPRAFHMATTEVTQAQWQRVMGTNPSTFRAVGPDAPVEQVTWDEVQEFLRRLSSRANARFRLPTEAEWEYACRAGTTTPYAFGEEISTNDANYDGRYPLPAQQPGSFRGKTTRVASFKPNAWGLFDMHGNVWEWCADEYCEYPVVPVTNPRNSCGSKYKVIRGGSWYFGADSARSALRYTHEPQLRGFSIGFRVVREP